jgi:hypothetical protein
MSELVVRGARLHILKNITFLMPKNRLVVFSGLSGSGKSTMAFDILHREGQRQYMESHGMVAYESRPPADGIEGLSRSIIDEVGLVLREFLSVMMLLLIQRIFPLAAAMATMPAASKPAAGSHLRRAAKAAPAAADPSPVATSACWTIWSASPADLPLSTSDHFRTEPPSTMGSGARLPVRIKP